LISESLRVFQATTIEAAPDGLETPTLIFQTHVLSIVRGSYATPPINFQVNTCNKLRLITRHEHTRIHHILNFPDATHRYITRELCPILRRILHPRERREKTRSSDEWADRIDPDLVETVFSSKSFRCLDTALAQHNLTIEDGVTGIGNSHSTPPLYWHCTTPTRASVSSPRHWQC
jgi:hypothetical protein